MPEAAANSIPHFMASLAKAREGLSPPLQRQLDALVALSLGRADDVTGHGMATLETSTQELANQTEEFATWLKSFRGELAEEEQRVLDPMVAEACRGELFSLLDNVRGDDEDDTWGSAMPGTGWWSSYTPEQLAAMLWRMDPPDPAALSRIMTAWSKADLERAALGSQGPGSEIG